jgi:hypothetical protein
MPFAGLQSALADQNERNLGWIHFPVPDVHYLSEVHVKRLLIFVTVWIGVGSSLAVLGSQGRGRGNGRGHDEESSATVSNARVFSKDEVRIIRDWFSVPANLKGLPPGLAKKDHLPPGLQRQLVRNGKLPPGLEKKIEPLPQTLEVRLPPVPEGCRRIVISGNIILWNEKAAAILDIVANVF